MRSTRPEVDCFSIETAGEVFPDSSIELIADQENVLLLLYTDKQTSRVGRTIEYSGHTYVPVELDARILRAVRLPSHNSDYVSTNALFTAIRETFTEHGFSEDISLVATHFVISTWFLDCIPAAPCLIITGSLPEAELLLDLLACLARHALRLSDFNPRGLSMLMQIKPTLLIGDVFMSASKLKLLWASNNPNTYVPVGDSLQSFYSAKAIYRGLNLIEDPFRNATLQINVTPLRGKLPILDSAAQKSIAREFQPKLLGYRTRNFEKVREATFDFPWLTSGARIVARILGACITDAPELQADLAPYFQRQEHAMREQNWLNKHCVAIEVVLALCHGRQNDRRLYIGEFADDVNAILKARGQNESLGPKELGLVVRSLGLTPKRSNKGYVLRLSDKVRRQIHKLAFEFDVAALLDGKPRCSHCREILKTDFADASPRSGKGERPPS